MAGRQLKNLVCYGCRGKPASGRCMKCGRTYCLKCLASHNYFLCDVKPTKGYPVEKFPDEVAVRMRPADRLGPA